MPAKNSLLINNHPTLDLWARQCRSLTWTRNLPVTQFQLAEFSHDLNHRFSLRVGNIQKACGCTSGGLFMSVTVITLIVTYFNSGNHFSNIGLSQVSSFVGITILATLSGKVLGLLWARWRLIRLASKILNRVTDAKQCPAIESTNHKEIYNGSRL